MLQLLNSRFTFTCLLLICSGAGFAQNSFTRFAYVVNPYDNAISGYRVTQDGRLLPNGMVYTKGKFPVALISNPSQQFLYSVSRTVDTIPIYKINPINGWLVETNESQFETRARSPFNFSFHPSGKFLYVAVRSGYVTGYSVSDTSGALDYISNLPIASGERTRNVKVHPSGRFVYAVNAYSNTISGFNTDAVTGALKPITGSPWSGGEIGSYDEYKKVYENLPDVTTGIGGMPYYIAIHPNGKFLYSTNFAAASVSVFAIDEGSGALTLKGAPVDTGFTPYAVAFHPNQRFLYVTSWESLDIWGYEVDAHSGALTPLPGSPFKETGDKPMSIQFNQRGDKAYVASSWSNGIYVYNVDTNSGKFTLHDITQSRAGAIDLVLVSGSESVKVKTETAVISNPQGKQLVTYRVNSYDGALNELARINAGQFPISLASDPRNRFLYAADYSDNSVLAYNVNLRTGKLTPIDDSPSKVANRPVAIMVDANGWYLYVLNQGQENFASYLIHVDTGQLAEAAESPVKVGKTPSQLLIDPIVRNTMVLNQSDKTISGYRFETTIHANLQEMTAMGSPKPFDFTPGHIAVEPTGRIAVVVDQAANRLLVYKLHVTSGFLEKDPLKEYKTENSASHVVFHPHGTLLYVIHQHAKKITTYSVNRLTMELSKVGPALSLDESPYKAIIDPSGRYMYILPESGVQLSKIEIDIDTGLLKNKQTITLNFPPGDLVFYREFH